GLATAAGGAVLLFPFALLLWLLIWVMIFLFRKNISWANIWATVGSLIIIFNSSTIAVKYSFPHAATNGELILFSMALFIIIFVRHIDPLKDLIKDKNFLRKAK
ncbi:MAG TPA: hypothetical protein VLB50_11390, partial [Ignavibacteriaceae bacterium]|nr:hypothetical protein [Ignavibacteriaceae bacterium]